MFPLDSFDTALNGMTLRELRQVSQRARKLLQEVQRLRQTPLVRSLVKDQLLNEDDLLYSPGFSFVSCLPQFNGLLKLPKLAKAFGARQRPDYQRCLTAVYKHIRSNTGQWHDRLLAEILLDLLPKEKNEINPAMLKKWRRDHNLKG